MKAAIVLICCLLLIPLGPTGVTGQQWEGGSAQVPTAPPMSADLKLSLPTAIDQANPPSQTSLQLGVSDSSVSLRKVTEFNIHGESISQFVPFQGNLLARAENRIMKWDENQNEWQLYPDIPSSIDEYGLNTFLSDFPGIAVINGELFALYSKWNPDHSLSGMIYDCKTKEHIHLPVVRYRYGKFWVTEQAIYITSDGNGHCAGGEGGEGVFVSYDHGQSWLPMNQGLTNLSVYGIEADPFGNMCCYGEGGFYRWQGSYWEKLIDAPYVFDVEFVATGSTLSSLTVYAANGGNLYVLNGGTVQTYPFDNFCAAGSLFADQEIGTSGMIRSSTPSQPTSELTFGALFVDLESGTLSVARMYYGVSTWNLADLNSRQNFFSGEVWAHAVYRKGPYLYAGLYSGYEGARKIDTRTGQFQLMNQGLLGNGGIRSGLLWQNNVYFGLDTMGILQYELSTGSAQMRYIHNPTSTGPPGEMMQILEHDGTFYVANIDSTVYKTADFQQFQAIHGGDYSGVYTSFSLYIDAQDHLFITPIRNTNGVFLCLDLQGNMLYQGEGLPETKYAWTVKHVVMENELDMALVLAPLSKVGEKFDIYLSHDAGQHWLFFREAFNMAISSYRDKLILCQENGTFLVDPSNGNQQKISDMNFTRMFVKNQYLFGTFNDERLVMIDLESGKVIEDLNLGWFGFPAELNANGNRILLSTASSRNFVFEIVGLPNHPPNLSTAPVPSDLATNTPTNQQLSWKAGGDPDGGAVTHDVYFDIVNPPMSKVSTGQSGTSYNPGPLVPSTSYYWKVVPIDEQGLANDSAAVWRFTTATSSFSLTYLLQPNWNMISLPVVPTSTDPQVVFSGLPSPWYLFEWNPLAGIYIGKELISLRLGAGYWLKVPMAVAYPIGKQTNGETQTDINLGLNWNLIGVPYEGTIPWGAVRVSKDGGALVTLDQAVSSNWIQGMFFHWNGSAYDMLTSGDNFQSLFGYWAKTKVTGVQLVFLKP